MKRSERAALSAAALLLLGACATASPTSPPPSSADPEPALSLADKIEQRLGRDLDAEDRRFIETTLSAALEDEPDAPARGWRNPTTGNEGEIDLIEPPADREDGGTCAIVQHVHRLDADRLAGDVTVCRDAGEAPWRVDEVAWDATEPPASVAREPAAPAPVEPAPGAPDEPGWQNVGESLKEGERAVEPAPTEGTHTSPVPKPKSEPATAAAPPPADGAPDAPRMQTVGGRARDHGPAVPATDAPASPSTDGGPAKPGAQNVGDLLEDRSPTAGSASDESW